MSRPHYPQGNGAGQSDYYASEYHGYYEDPEYYNGQQYHPNYQYDYSQDPSYYEDPNANYHYDRDYYEYQQPSRRPHPAHPPSQRDHARGPPAMNPPRRPEQQYVDPSHPPASAWEVSQEDYAMSDQWPLASPPMQAPPQQTTAQTMRTPPRRPQRPDDPREHHGPQSRGPPPPGPQAPPASRQYAQSNPNSHHGNGQWTGDGYSYAPPPNYPPPSRPPPQRNGPPAATPQYTTPQAPRQVVYGQANQRPPLGPPPSARRGTSSFYPQVGPVHPIVEETDSMRSSIRTESYRATSVHVSGHNSKVSVASSNAIPIGLEAPRIRRPDLTSSSEDSFVESPIEPALGHVSRNEHMSHSSRDVESPEIMLVRQASLGRKQRPHLTTVKSTDRKPSGSNTEMTALPTMPGAVPSGVELARSNTQKKLEGQSQPGAADVDHEAGRQFAAQAAAAQEIVRSASKREASDGIPPTSAKPFQTPSSGESPARNGLARKHSKDFTTLSNELNPTRSTARSPLAPAVDPRVESILRSLEKGGAISEAEAEELKTPMAGMSGRKRPPRLDVDAVRDAEARGSLSSLPELIRRATRLASNLDRGKTASRLGMNWIEGARDDEKRRSIRSSGMLSVFGADGTRDPNGRAEKGTSFGRWSKMMRHSSLGSESDGGHAKPKRTCCGMPLWLFILLLILLLMLVAAAVIVPVLLVVVLPDKNDGGSTANASASSLAQCEKKVTCQNGGTNILSANGFCECLCVNGYTGTSCGKYSAAGCTMTTIGSVTNATVGDAIPRLLEEANANFSIPLDGQSVLGVFSSSDSSCSVQNSLVTFDGKSSKRSLLYDVVLPYIHPRQDATPSTSSSSETATATSSSSTSTSTAGSDKQLDFARVAVLYVLQESSEIDHAATAQENLASYFQNGETTSGSTANARNISLGNGFSCNLDSLSLNLANGTSVGGSA